MKIGKFELVFYEDKKLLGWDINQWFWIIAFIGMGVLIGFKINVGFMEDYTAQKCNEFYNPGFDDGGFIPENNFDSWYEYSTNYSKNVTIT